MQKLFSLLTVIILLSAIHASANDVQWTEEICFRWSLQPIGQTDQVQLIVDTMDLLTKDKDQAIIIHGQKFQAFTETSDIEKYCTPMAISMQGRLKKIPDVANVTIGLRQLAVRIFPWPNVWQKDSEPQKGKEVLPDVLSVIREVLCGVPSDIKDTKK